MKLEFSRQSFEKYSDVEFYEKSVQWEPSCSVLTDGQTDMTKLRVAFRNFVDAPKILHSANIERLWILCRPQDKQASLPYSFWFL
jgi:hypothetical protein